IRVLLWPDNDISLQRIDIIMIQGRKAVEQFGQLELLKEFNQTLPPNRQSLVIHAPPPPPLTLTPPPSRNSPVGTMDYFSANLHQLTLLSQRDNQSLLQPVTNNNHNHNHNINNDNYYNLNLTNNINLHHHHDQPQALSHPSHINMFSSAINSSLRSREFDPVVGSGRPTNAPPQQASSSYIRQPVGLHTPHLINPCRPLSANCVANNSGHAVVKSGNIGHAPGNPIIGRVLNSAAGINSHYGNASHSNTNGITNNSNSIGVGFNDHVIHHGSNNNINTNNASNQRGCPFCRRNNESDAIVMSHRLRDDQGRVTCPQLKKHKCEICGATGELAHTRSYCHQLKHVRELGLMRSSSEGIVSIIVGEQCGQCWDMNAAQWTNSMLSTRAEPDVYTDDDMDYDNNEPWMPPPSVYTRDDPFPVGYEETIDRNDPYIHEGYSSYGTDDHFDDPESQLDHPDLNDPRVTMSESPLDAKEVIVHHRKVFVAPKTTLAPINANKVLARIRIKIPVFIPVPEEEPIIEAPPPKPVFKYVKYTTTEAKPVTKMMDVVTQVMQPILNGKRPIELPNSTIVSSQKQIASIHTLAI
ncbi:Nanos-like 1, partial [Fragariocoptes setiger]